MEKLTVKELIERSTNLSNYWKQLMLAELKRKDAVIEKLKERSKKSYDEGFAKGKLFAQRNFEKYAEECRKAMVNGEKALTERQIEDFRGWLGDLLKDEPGAAATIDTICKDISEVE